MFTSAAVATWPMVSAILEHSLSAEDKIDLVPRYMVKRWHTRLVTRVLAGTLPVWWGEASARSSALEQCICDDQPRPAVDRTSWRFRSTRHVGLGPPPGAGLPCSCASVPTGPRSRASAAHGGIGKEAQ